MGAVVVALDHMECFYAVTTVVETRKLVLKQFFSFSFNLFGGVLKLK